MPPAVSGYNAGLYLRGQWTYAMDIIVLVLAGALALSWLKYGWNVSRLILRRIEVEINAAQVHQEDRDCDQWQTHRQGERTDNDSADDHNQHRSTA